eukprot:5226614-Amphidinium_carterae.2
MRQSLGCVEAEGMLGDKFTKRVTLHVACQGLPDTDKDNLYALPQVVAFMFRQLPAVAQQVVMRMLLTGSTPFQDFCVG